ncbi:zinc finger BED domain-containing protein DAYSLEEPER-like [Lycium ferocissimum]|uniref:zinc finger BED domain-containing protein DAYSLEEPER-like n=1 Tax=Lycium ferocissimum TaxID=112874 RepID=UPI002814C193|nr:zinc finger BED domain-containing protein DAYSLEEPER-like [Lycium ferocissimum]
MLMKPIFFSRFTPIPEDLELQNEALDRAYGNLDFDEFENLEVEEGEELDLNETPTSPVTGAPTWTTSQSEAGFPSKPPTRGTTKAQRPRTSPVWKFMTLDDTKTQAICHKCKGVIKHGSSGGAGGSGGSGGLDRHLRTCVGKPYFDARLAAGLKNTPPGASSAAPGGSIGRSNMVQQTLNSSNPAVTQIAYNKVRDREELAKMVAVCGLPFSFPSNPDFVHYIRAMYNLNFQGIPRSTVTTDVFKFQSDYCQYMRCVFHHLDTRVSVTSDIGRSVNSNDYLCVTTHWIGHNWNMQKSILDYKYTDEKKTSSYISTNVLDILQLYGLVDKVLIVTLDNASSRTKSAELMAIRICPINLDIFHVRCACHVFNLVVKDGLDLFEGSLQKIQYACQYVFSAHKQSRINLCNLFKKYYVEQNLPVRKIPKEVCTRWNSLCECYLLFTNIKNPFNMFLMHTIIIPMNKYKIVIGMKLNDYVFF